MMPTHLSVMKEGAFGSYVFDADPRIAVHATSNETPVEGFEFIR